MCAYMAETRTNRDNNGTMTAT